MTVYTLWSAPRARSTAFFVSMAERGDMLALHEPFWNLQAFGAVENSPELARFAAPPARCERSSCPYPSAGPFSSEGWLLGPATTVFDVDEDLGSI